MKVFVRAPIHPDAIALLRADSRIEIVACDDPAAGDWEREADAVILRGQKISAEEIQRAAKLKVISRHGAGVDAVDLEAAKAKGIKVMNTPFENSQSVAEMAVALMLAAGRRIVNATSLVRDGKWAEGRTGAGCRELCGGTAGFVGFGRIARITAAILRTGFSMNILAYDPFLPQGEWEKLQSEAAPCRSLNELFGSCDYVSLHVPKTKDTAGMISAEVLAAAKKGLILVNTARGGLVDEKALYDALKNGTIGGAAFDVFEKEPLDPANPLLSLPNFIATPHYAGSTEECLRRVATTIARETVAALFDQETPQYRYL